MGAYNSPMSGGRHERIFPARRDALPQIAAFLAEVCAAASFSREGCLRLTLLVEELFTNTVMHGHGGDSEEPVRVVGGVSPRRAGPASGPLGASAGATGCLGRAVVIVGPGRLAPGPRFPKSPLGLAPDPSPSGELALAPPVCSLSLARSQLPDSAVMGSSPMRCVSVPLRTRTRGRQ